MPELAGDPTCAQVRLERLLAANQAVIAEGSTGGLLRQIILSAQLVVPAEAVALAVLGEDGRVEQVVSCGPDGDASGLLIGLPLTCGLLPLLLEQTGPVLLPDPANARPRPALPAGHPAVGPGLGVPVRTSSTTYGALYLARRVATEESGPHPSSPDPSSSDNSSPTGFTTEDQDLLSALAATAAVALENDRLISASRRRAEWLRASFDISRRLMADPDGTNVLQVIADSVRRLSGSDVVYLGLPDADDADLLVAEVVSGSPCPSLQGSRIPVDQGRLHEVMHGGQPVVMGADDPALPVVDGMAARPGDRQLAAFPLVGSGPPHGAVVVVRSGERAFSAADLELMDSFVGQAGLALELADARSYQHQVTMLEDRAVIARELHEQVVQKLFAAGLTLQGSASMVTDVPLERRLKRAVDDVDDAIRTIRSSVFELEARALPGDSVGGRMLRVLAELATVLGFSPQLSVEGPLETVVDDGLATELEAVLRETLTNTAKHAEATAVDVGLIIHGRALTLTVADNGVGLRPSARRSGLANLRARATGRGGELELGVASQGGLLVRWSVPLEI